MGGKRVFPNIFKKKRRINDKKTKKEKKTRINNRERNRISKLVTNSLLFILFWYVYVLNKKLEDKLRRV